LAQEQEDGINHARETAPFDDSIAEIQQALGQAHIVPITGNVISSFGFAIFGSGNPGPDSEGCQRSDYRNDCIRVLHDLSSSFNNELAYPNRIDGIDSLNYFQEIQINPPTSCNTAPSTIDHINLQFSAYSSGGTQGTPNKLDVETDEQPLGPPTYQDFCVGCGPAVNGANRWITWPTVYHNLAGGPIPKSAICGTSNERWSFHLTMNDARDFPNKSWDGNDWLAIGDVVILAYW
jgi:hypothetical protein